MSDLIIPVLFYIILSTIVCCLHKSHGFGKIFRRKNFDKLKLHLGTLAYFFVNLNIMFYCLFCKECNVFCLTFALSGVITGLIIYLYHLTKQTIAAFKLLIEESEFEFIAPFISIPYFVLLGEIFMAVQHSNLASLSYSEAKMITVMLYPFFVLLAELIMKLKEIDDN